MSNINKGDNMKDIYECMTEKEHYMFYDSSVDKHYMKMKWLEESQETVKEIISTLAELGQTQVSISQLQIRLMWWERDGNFLTETEFYELKMARGQKLTPYQKRKYEMHKENFKHVLEMKREYERENS